MDVILEAIRQPFMQRAFVIAILIGIITAWLGVYVILRGMAFVGAGIAHASFGGIAIGLFSGLPPLFTAGVFTILIALGISKLFESSKLREDTAVGISFAASMAFGVLLLSFTSGYQGEILGYLFGSILAITPVDLWLTLILGILIIVILLGFSKEWRALTFDPEFTAVQGFPISWLNHLFLVLVALTVLLAVKMVGIIMLSALLVIPSATALLFTRNFRSLECWSVGIGGGVSMVGLLLSYLWNIPPGATIVIMATILFFVVWLTKNKRK